MTIDCRDERRGVRFRVHLHLRARDGREWIGASGKPDPKFLSVDGSLYAVAPPAPTGAGPQSGGSSAGNE